jgi:hypothetical protein
MKANALTGSVVVEHARAFDAIASDASRDGIFELRRGTGKPAGSGAGAPPGEAETFSMLALGFTGMSAYQLARGRYMGSAVENFWNAYGSYRTLGRPSRDAPGRLRPLPAARGRAPRLGGLPAVLRRKRPAHGSDRGSGGHRLSPPGRLRNPCRVPKSGRFRRTARNSMRRPDLVYPAFRTFFNGGEPEPYREPEPIP